jgi:diguanylate cyclase (GGDEF)-like protein/PAS domain S-box-containing protein
MGTESERRSTEETADSSFAAELAGSGPTLLQSDALLATFRSSSLAALTRVAAAALGVEHVVISIRTAAGRLEHSTDLPEPWLRHAAAVFAKLCGQVIDSEEPITIEDVSAHPPGRKRRQLKTQPLAAYAGVPLITAEGHVLGSLSALDARPRQWAAAELGALADVALCVCAEVERQLELRRTERNEKYFRALVENAQDVVSVLDADGIIRYQSPSITQVLGYTADELLGTSAFELVHPDDLPAILEAFGKVLATPGMTLAVEYRFRHRDGSWSVLESVGTAVTDADGPGVVVHSRDVAGRITAGEQLRVQQAYLEQLFESAPEGVVLLDPDDHVLRINPEFTRMFGYTADEAVGRTINELIVPAAQHKEARGISRRVAAGERVFLETVRSRKDGSPVDVSILATPITLGENRIAVYGIYRDIGARKHAEAQLAAYAEELRALSLTDELTGLYNRRGFYTVAEQEIKRARRTHSRMVLLFLDVDGMKEINDTIGHLAGDQALRAAAQALRASFRDSDVIARMGGDEFAVLARAGRRGSARSMETRLREVIQQHNNDLDRPFTLSMSIGSAAWSPATDTPLADLIGQADRRMYEDKQA